MCYVRDARTYVQTAVILYAPPPHPIENGGGIKKGDKSVILWNYFEIRPLAKEEMSFNVFFLFLALAAILFSRAELL